MGSQISGLSTKTVLQRLERRFLEEEEKLALFMKRIINFQHVISYRGVLLRIDWWIINLLLVSGLQEDGPG